MASASGLRELCKEIVKNCIGCNNCVSHCRLLQQIGEDISGIAKREPSVAEAYACSLCGLCEAVCPSSLSLRSMFAATRRNAVDNQYISIDDYRYMFPDRPLNVMSMYRKIKGISYHDLDPGSKCRTVYFPGCTLLTYAPELTRASYFELKKKYQEIALITDCCGLSLFQLGIQSRYEDHVRTVMSKLLSLGVKELVTACPNCYYQLRPILEEAGIKIVTVYEALTGEEMITKSPAGDGKPVITIHDSCPDRFYGFFADQARQALSEKGYTLVEMTRNRNTTVCCGSGGQVTHFRPELAQDLVQSRLAEAEKTGADVLVAYCLGCVLNFSKIPGKIKIRHVLNLLLGLEEDYTGIKDESKKLFDGPQGEKYWTQIMAE